MILIAIGDRKLLDQARATAKRLAQLMKAKAAVHQHRPWGFPVAPGSPGFTKSLQDAQFFRVGNRHKRPIDELTFEEGWGILDWSE
ncbi:MAG TPA: hypothetical protein VMD30_10600 [Tepidisphaeraceae bacterium]|nr:hypothetical protein [Tepidisphaeraceae bacterium]